MEQVLFGGDYGSLDDTLTEFNTVVSGSGWSVNQLIKSKPVSTNGIIKNLRVKLDGSPGGGNSYTFTLEVNGASSILQVNITGDNTSGVDTDEVDVVAGDLISLKCIPSGTPTVRKATWTFMFEGETSNESLILGGTRLSLSNAATEYCSIMGAGGSPSITENDQRQVCPTAGTIKDFYVELSADPGTAPSAYRFTVRLNGATVAQSLIVTITADDTTGSDLVHNLAVVAGDVLTVKIEPLNAPSETPTAIWGMTFVADVDGESIVMGGTKDDLNTTLTEYNVIMAYVATNWGVDETYYFQHGQECTLKKLYMLLSAAPGVGNNYTFTIRIAIGDSNVVATVSGAATTGNSGALQDTVANDDYVTLKVVPYSNPDVADAYWGFVSYRAPPAVGLENKSANMGSKMVAAGLI